MNKNSRKNLKKIVFCLVILTVMMNLYSGEKELGPCEIAFFRCFNDSLWRGATPEGLFHCLLGYGFCKKYIESERGF